MNVMNVNAKYDPTENEKRMDAFISVYYVFILILFGAPMWYLTTSTYRASLPLNEIEQLFNSKITVSIKLNIIVFETIAEMDDMLSFEEKLFSSLRTKQSFNDSSVTFKYYGYVRPASSKEWQAHRYGKSMSELESLSALDGSDSIYILILPRNTMLLKENQEGFVRSKSENNVIYLKMAPWEKLRLKIESLVVNLLTSNTYLNHVYKAVSEIPSKEKFDKISTKIRSLFTRVRTATTYDWTFSLIVPNPLGGSEPEWNFARLQRLYLEPLQRKLSKFIHVRVSSQVIYGVRLEKLWPSRQVGPRERVYSKEDLTHVVNGLETYLGSSGDAHFVAYLASGPGGQQVHLERSTGVRSKLDVFTVPRWGGVVLVNNASVPLPGDDIMMSFLPQVLSLVGLSRPSDHEGAAGHGSSAVTIEDRDQSSVAPWQVNNWLRERTVENIAITQVTLHSVSDLLDKVINMVIRDDVAASIRLSVQLANDALAMLAAVPSSGTDGRHGLMSSSSSLQDAFVASKRALEAAETAFFHPSLLELLYFQEDQKYGIYIPLFVPVLLPLFLAALKARPYLRTALGTMAGRKTKTD